MEECYGNGSCLCNETPVTCIKACKPIACANYSICASLNPQWILDCNGGLCSSCTFTIGKVTYLDTIDSCPICLDSKKMIQIHCQGKHTVCIDCWRRWATNIHVRCMICRGSMSCFR